MSNNRIKSLDSLRGIASMIVVIFHCLIAFTIFEQANFNRFANDFLKYFTITPLHTLWAGREAVLLFFVLSGFVLAIPFFEGKTQSYGAYAIRRFCRIYIPYIVLMLASALLLTFFLEYKDIQGLSGSYDNRWNHPVTLKAIIAYFLMENHDTTNVNGVVWTLFHEMRISLILPLFLLIIRRFNLIGAAILSLGLNFLIYFALDSWAAMLDEGRLLIMVKAVRWSMYYCTCFILGALLSKYRNKLPKLKIAYTAVLVAVSLVLINCRWMVVLFQVKDQRITDVITIAGILLLFAAVLSSDRLNSFLSLKPFTWLGQISFSLYLVHIPVMMIITIFLGKIIPIEAAFLLVPLASLPVAHFTYKYVELPSNKLGRSIANAIEGRRKKNSKNVPISRAV
ncbi:acyltransferase family protein [Paenibacillus harenae]|uniref:Peptidoglycan/LPS O-acetylase OafA/YrhL n=1 Tax=Paenibacillus harenae TaxID=306543 RepID=A0ABT9U1W6_PAEHA|nr:acyltransferase [Paenibacillus harenae]MDQ0113610.1 peptidoglycan/LPS O-acetylase OafA/YrhL [Paenibacillus harenae]